MDACFTQKKNKGAPDPEKTHPDTHFVPEDLSRKMEEYVEAVRQGAEKEKKARAGKTKTKGEGKGKGRAAHIVDSEDEEDGYEHEEIKVPRSALNNCRNSFTAADENRAKANTAKYDDTGLMAMLCRHDRVLWVVNMHSAGGKQFNVLLLMEILFQHIPRKATIGILYNIACQLERGARKWGWLDRYLACLIFAVSIFHAFGHDWACQMRFHPRKRKGFGFTNGEGCERLWHAISHLIAHLRISEYYRRLYTLDMQLKAEDEKNLFDLGKWLKRRTLHSVQKRAEAEGILEECGVELEELREEWEKQLTAQTKPLQRQSKNMAQKAVDQILALRKAWDIRQRQLKEAHDAFQRAVDDEDEEEIAVQTAEMEKHETALKETKKKLKNKEAALGANEKSRLKEVAKSKFYELRMRARGFKHRLRAKLQERKFAMDGVERRLRHLTVREQQLRDHASKGLKRKDPGISELCKHYNQMVHEGGEDDGVPPNAVAPENIDPKGMWHLDVDDAIWQDVGLDDDEDDDDGAPPRWLADDDVRKGILAMLDIDRADEEDETLQRERRAMQVWFAEEWELVNSAMDNADNRGEKYAFWQRRQRLLGLCAEWQRHAPPCDDSELPEWGPSRTDIMQARYKAATAWRGQDLYGEEEVVEGEGEEEYLSRYQTFDEMDAVAGYLGGDEDEGEGADEASAEDAAAVYEWEE
ncbi:hypothetical protein FB45DRAFT_977229 [Roridomyces roridus]|uniref:Uncharacterized protein n=1 Tax=Roridomyces roridus TaxID=1738132 RepID=A0AAD7C615_9AGAR|nr:hypothetical protein FB45DRAFT_977229 [Roridomyces roridus]